MNRYSIRRTRAQTQLDSLPDYPDQRSDRGAVQQDALSVMLYYHDTYGVGHVTLTLTLARYLRAHTPSMSQLIVTGSPVANNFPFPEGADYIKLPSVLKVGAEQDEPHCANGVRT